MNILVTGGAGFIGAALAERLVAAGHRVTAIDDCSTGRAERLGSGVALHLADIAAGDLDAAFRSAAPDAVVHLAAMASIAESMRAPERCAAVNVCGTVRVLRQCAKHGVRRFVFGSTGGALYGDSAPFPTPESQPAAAVSPYGASKAAAELFVAAMCAPAGIRHTVLRLGNVYGPGVDGTGGSGVVAAFARAALDGKPPAICGDGMQTRDYVHLDDILDAHLRVIDSGRDGVFNLGTGTQRTVLEVFETVAGAAGYRGVPTHGPARPGEARRSCLDSERAARLLGWTACVPFTEGVGRTVRALAEARAR
ncbi:MAG: NAD-dependent epimerase/dehydratase family protein [Defluviicoccus sp.]|nr:NAD-dependent epimerase/dehydratase family protein [Defluviicoccus sp.]